MILLILIIIIVLVFVIQYHVKYHRRNYLLSKIPSLPSYPLIGSGLSFLGKSGKDILDILTLKARELGDIYKIDFTPYTTTIVVDNVKIAEKILSSQKFIEKSVDYELISDWLGDGLLLSTDKKWHSRRKIITPAFHFKILEEFFSIMEGQGNIFINNLERFENQHFDIIPCVSLYTLDVICEAAMGYEMNAQTDDTSEYVKAVHDISDVLFLKMFNPLLRSTPLFYVSGLHRRQKQSLKILHSFTESVIKKRRDEIKLNENFTKKQKVDEFGIKRKMAFLDILLQSEIDGRLLTDKDIREEVDTFMFEGHDTTASAIVFTLYNIAKFPVVQSKIYEECELFLGDKNEPRSSQQMNELSYLEQVIKETLRLYPSVPFFSRKIKEEVDCGEYLIPENVTLAIAPYSMARNPNTYPNPLEFDPSRFSLENDFEKRNPFSFIPFSAGPRNCIGQKFAMLEMKSIVSKIVQHYEISIKKENEELELVAELVLRAINGVKLCFKKRV